MSKPYTEFVHPDDVNSTEVASKQISDGVQVHRFVNRYKIKSGGWAELEWNTATESPTGFVYAVTRVLSKTDEDE